MKNRKSTHHVPYKPGVSKDPMEHMKGKKEKGLPAEKITQPKTDGWGKSQKRFA